MTSSQTVLVCENAGWTDQTLPQLSASNLTVNSVSISGNWLNDLPRGYFRAFPYVSSLNLINNHLKVVPRAIEQVETIERLQLSQNEITLSDGNSILQNNEMLSILYLSHNRITRIYSSTFSGLKNLKWLSLLKNRITIIDEDAFYSNVKLTHLALGFNRIMALQDNIFSKLVNLQALGMIDNQLQRLTKQSLANLSKLQKLLLSRNQISELEVGVFNGNPALTHLQLGSNKIKFIPSGVFHNMANLTELHIEANEIHNLPNDMFINKPKLTLLGFSAMALESMPKFPRMPRLEKIDLGYNKIRRVYQCDVENLPELQELYLHGNPMDCDCHMLWYRTWVDEVMLPSMDDMTFLVQLRDVWLCHGPGYMKGVEVLMADLESFVCDDGSVPLFCRHSEETEDPGKRHKHAMHFMYSYNIIRTIFI